MDSNKQVTATFNGGGGGGGSCTQDYLRADPSNPTANQSTTISWSMTCTGEAYDPRVEERDNGNVLGEQRYPPNTWERGPYPTGTTRRYCTAYSLGNSKITAGNCITVTWRQAEPPQIRSFTSSCSTCHGQYTLSWTTQYADSCTLNGQSVPVNGSQRESTPRDECYTDSDCGSGEDYKCAGVTESVTHTLTCSNSAGSTSQSLTVTEGHNECRPGGRRPPFPRQ